MQSYADIAKAVEERGARYCITATIRRNELAYRYADTGEAAEKIRADYQDNWHYHNIKVHPPVFDMDIATELAKLGKERADLKRAEQEVTAKLRATVLRASEHSFAEADIARRANIDRMTVRKWLDKR